MVMSNSTDATSGYFRRVVGRVHVAMARWREAPTEQRTLAELRDAFAVLSEHSAASQVAHLYDLGKGVINLLSRLIDGSVEYDGTVLVLLDDITEYIGGHWNSFGLREEKSRDRLNLLLERTDLLASGGFDLDTDRVEGKEVRGSLEPAIDESTFPSTTPAGPQIEAEQESSMRPLPRTGVQDTARLESLPPNEDEALSRRFELKIATVEWIERLVAETLEIKRDEVDLKFKPGVESVSLHASLAEYLEPSLKWLFQLAKSRAEAPKAKKEIPERRTRRMAVQAVLKDHALELLLHSISCQSENKVVEAPVLELHSARAALDQMPSELSARLIQTGSTVEFVPTNLHGEALAVTIPVELALLECRMFVSDSDAYLVPEDAVVELCEDRFRWRLEGSRARLDGKSSYAIVKPGSHSEVHWVYQGIQTKNCLVAVFDGSRDYAFVADSIGPSLSVPVSVPEEGASTSNCVCTLEDGRCALLLDLTNATTRPD